MLPSASRLQKGSIASAGIDGPTPTVRPGPSPAGRPNACGVGAPHLIFKEITCRDLERRYGYFLDHVQRSERLDRNGKAASYVTPERVDRFSPELQARVSSVTVYGSIYKLRRMAQLLALGRDFTWLTEIEKDLALVMQPRSKFNRLVYANVLLEAGMTLDGRGGGRDAPIRTFARPAIPQRPHGRAAGTPSDSSEEFCRT